MKRITALGAKAAPRLVAYCESVGCQWCADGSEGRQGEADQVGVRRTGHRLELLVASAALQAGRKRGIAGPGVYAVICRQGKVGTVAGTKSALTAAPLRVANVCAGVGLVDPGTEPSVSLCRQKSFQKGTTEIVGHIGLAQTIRNVGLQTP